MEHDDVIFWPNGKGETPCTTAYALLHAERDNLHRPGFGVTLDEMTPDEYQRYCELDNELGSMQLNGHLGTSIRY